MLTFKCDIALWVRSDPPTTPQTSQPTVAPETTTNWAGTTTESAGTDSEPIVLVATKSSRATRTVANLQIFAPAVAAMLVIVGGIGFEAD